MLLAVLCTVAAALAGLVAVALARPLPVRGPGAPAGAVQTYVAAVAAQDSVAAADLLAASSPCGATDLDSVRIGDETAVDLVGVDEQGTRAVVHVRVTSGTDPLGGSQEDVTFRLVRVSSGWRIDGVPWPLHDCTGG